VWAFRALAEKLPKVKTKPHTGELCGAVLEVINPKSRSRKALAVVPNMANRSHLHAMTMIFKDLLRQVFFVVR
jgi:hypothetical protein